MPSVAAHRRLSQTFSSFRHRNYQLWFGGQIVSVIGTWMQSIAQGWLVYELSRSEFALGLVGFAGAIPSLIVGPWGGVIADLMPKRRLLVITQMTAMLLAFVLAALAFSGVVQVWHIIIMAMLLGVVNAFDAPARQAFVVEMVGREDLSNAIALNSMTFNSARMIGPALGGVLLAAVGSAWCFLINGISFVAVIASLLAMKVEEKPLPKHIEQPMKRFVEGLNYTRSRKDVAGLIILSAVFGMFGLAYASLLPAFVDQVLNAGATAYGTLNAFTGIGAVLGAFLVANLSGSGVRGKIVTAANLTYPLLLTAFAFNQVYPVALGLVMVMGTTFMLQSNNINSLLQLNIDDNMRGRVMSLFMITFFGLSPFGSLLAGTLAERLPMSLTIALLAGMMLVGSLIVHWKVPEIRRLK